MSTLLANDLMEELSEDNERVTEELNDLHSKYTQLRDNPRLGSVGDLQTHHVTHRSSGRPPTWDQSKTSSLVDESCRRSLRECPIIGCDQWFETLEEYHKHLDQIHCKRVYNVCDKRYVTHESLSRHETSVEYNVAVNSSGLDVSANELIPKIDLQINGSAMKTMRPSLRTPMTSEIDCTSRQLIPVLVPLTGVPVINTSLELSQKLPSMVSPSAVVPPIVTETGPKCYRSPRECPIIACHQWFETPEEYHKHLDQIHCKRVYNVGDRSVVNDKRKTLFGTQTGDTQVVAIDAIDERLGIASVDGTAADVESGLRPEFVCRYGSCGQRFITREAFESHTKSYETIAAPVDTSVANSVIIGDQILVETEEISVEEFPETSDENEISIDNRQRIEDIYECNECQELCLSSEELNEHMNTDHKVMSFVAFYESIGGQHSDTESTPEPHIQHMNTTSGQQFIECEDQVEDHASDSNGSTNSSDKVTTDLDNRETSDEDSDDYINAIDGQSGGFKCDYNNCRKVFSESKAYRRHRLTHSVDKRLKCLVNNCGFQCERRYEMREHMSVGHDGVDLYPCQLLACDQLIRTADDLLRHSDSAAHQPIADQSSGVSPPPDAGLIVRLYKCTFNGCEDVFNDLRTRERHRLIHSDDANSHLMDTSDALKCHFIGCGKRFKQKPYLERHRLIHSGDKPYECPIDGCDYRSYRHDIVTTHVKGHRLTTTTDQSSSVRPNDWRYKCGITGCEKVFATLRGKRRHRFTHTGEKQLKCPHRGCHYRCYRLDALNVHRLTHTTAAATIGFKRSDSLRRHRLIHSDDKRYKCPIDGCDYRCRRRYLLTAHTNRHLGVRPYVCAVQTCRKAFVSKYYLKDHQLVHSDERPNRCSLCNRRYKRRFDLHRHQSRAHH